MIDPGALEAHIVARGPWLFHATHIDNVSSILERGIVPGSELGCRNAKGFHRTRPGHVYVSKLEHCRHLQAAGDLAKGTIRVDLRQLDPRRIDPDEDMVQQAYWGYGHNPERWVAAAPPIKGPSWSEGPSGEGTLAYWAENTPGFDAPTVTARSLRRGRISYRGTVPPAALASA